MLRNDHSLSDVEHEVVGQISWQVSSPKLHDPNVHEQVCGLFLSTEGWGRTDKAVQDLTSKSVGPVPRLLDRGALIPLQQPSHCLKIRGERKDFHVYFEHFRFDMDILEKLLRPGNEAMQFLFYSTQR